MNEHLLKLETNAEDLEIIQQIFRSAHTLKGMSATMGFADMTTLTHEMESIFALFQNKQLQMNSTIYDVLFHSLDLLESMLQDIIAGGTGKSDVVQIVNTLKSVMVNEETAQLSNEAFSLDEYQHSFLLQSLQSGQQVFQITVYLREDCLLKSARAYMVFENLAQYGEIIASLPAVLDLEQEKFEHHFTLFYISEEAESFLKETILSISEIDVVDIVSLDSPMLEQLASKRSQATNQAAVHIDTTIQEHASLQAIHTPVTHRTIRVDATRLDTMMNLLSELLIDRVRLEQLAKEIQHSELTDTIEHVSQVSSELQNMVLNLRMIPVEMVFNRFPRMVRDLAKSLGKKVELFISGAETELDRMMIDELGDPLVHLLRNALDHGIETVQERIAANKPEFGSIFLRAYQSGHHVYIEIEEDGKGIQRDKVLQTALMKEIISNEAAQKMTEDEIYQLLFSSGFSTAEKISDISGRGVGLDVVKSKISSLGGQITINSTPGKGSKFTVKLPLTLSIITAILIRVGYEKYALPITSIVETSLIQAEQIQHVQASKMLHYHGEFIPVIFLSTILNCPGSTAADQAEREIVVIRKGERMAALVVDEFIGQQEMVLKPLGGYLSNAFAISGATILGDGRVALILDANALFKD